MMNAVETKPAVVIKFGTFLMSRYGHKVYISKCGKFAIVAKPGMGYRAFDVSSAPQPLHLESIKHACRAISRDPDDTLAAAKETVNYYANGQ